ncbi:MAG: hypothetical protein JNK58_01255 [Phycisphaerae bacterium]|nr:hypothetical protein [Phycisphaerae bacterium]
METLNAGTLGASTFHVRVFDAGPNPIANQTVQLYDLTVRVGASTAPPLAIAGVNKRVAANTNCFFMGDLNSAANEGTLSFPGSFDWDLDGDGVFETSDIAQPSRMYPSNGVHTVRLRVTDSNNQSSTDSITVTVHGATTTVGGCTPSAGQTSTTVPVTISGTNFKNVTAASMVTVSGTGVSVTGTPVPNALGTSLSGLSFVIAGSAAAGSRSVTVSNSDGTGIGAGVFTVTSSPPSLPGAFTLTSPANDAFLESTTPVLSWATSAGAQSYNVKVDNDPTFSSPEYNANTGFASVVVPPGPLAYKTFYYWRVTANNLSGGTMSTPASRRFRTGPCGGDANSDRVVNFTDITKVLENWASAYFGGQSGPGDANGDDAVNFSDITNVLEFWDSSCP